jgi:hypothetical protein
MIQSLRQTHRRIVTLLAVVLLVIFIAGLLVRRPFPVSTRLPAALTNKGSAQ